MGGGQGQGDPLSLNFRCLGRRCSQISRVFNGISVARTQLDTPTSTLQTSTCVASCRKLTSRARHGADAVNCLAKPCRPRGLDSPRLSGLRDQSIRNMTRPFTIIDGRCLSLSLRYAMLVQDPWSFQLLFALRGAPCWSDHSRRRGPSFQMEKCGADVSVISLFILFFLSFFLPSFLPSPSFSLFPSRSLSRSFTH